LQGIGGLDALHMLLKAAKTSTKMTWLVAISALMICYSMAELVAIEKI
jgi:hypothetical protein